MLAFLHPDDATLPVRLVSFGVESGQYLFDKGGNIVKLVDIDGKTSVREPASPYRSGFVLSLRARRTSR